MSSTHSADDWFKQRQSIFYPKTDMPAPDEVLRGLRDRTLAELRMTPDRIAAAAEHVFGIAPESRGFLGTSGHIPQGLSTSRVGRTGRARSSGRMPPTISSMISLSTSMLGPAKPLCKSIFPP